MDGSSMFGHAAEFFYDGSDLRVPSDRTIVVTFQCVGCTKLEPCLVVPSVSFPL